MINTAEYMREYRKRNREKLNAYLRERRKKDPEKARKGERKYQAKESSKLLQAERQRRRRQERRDEFNAKAREYLRRRYTTDEQHRIKCQLRSRLYSALRGKSKAGSAVTLLGCSIDYFQQYLERQFEPGWGWHNRKDWHIDHIIPLCAFDLTDPSQLAKACHYTNLRPLGATENRKKGGKLPNMETPRA